MRMEKNRWNGNGKEIWTNRGMGMELKWTRNGNGPGMSFYYGSLDRVY